MTPAEGIAIDLVKGNTRRYSASVDDGSFRVADLELGDYTLTIADLVGDGIARRTATLSAQGQVIDLGDIVLDEEPPRVLAITPADGTADVAGDVAIVIEFSEPVRAATVNSTNIVVAKNGVPVAGILALEPLGTRAVFTPSQPLPSHALVSVKVKTGVTDLVGKPLDAETTAVFTTRDVTPPTLASVSPAAGAVNVPLEAVVRVTYDEAVAPAQFGGPAIVLWLDGVPVVGQLAFLFGDTVAVLTPAAPLLPNRTYSVTLAPATDLAGNRQVSGLTQTFATLDVVAPIIQALTAVGGPTVTAGDIATIVADLGSADDVAFVEFLVDGQVMRTDTAAPLACCCPLRLPA